jgi:hypothetical protein
MLGRYTTGLQHRLICAGDAEVLRTGLFLISILACRENIGLEADSFSVFACSNFFGENFHVGLKQYQRSVGLIKILDTLRMYYVRRDERPGEVEEVRLCQLWFTFRGASSGRFAHHCFQNRKRMWSKRENGL